MILDTTSKSLQVVLSGAVTTNQLTVTGSYADFVVGNDINPVEFDCLTNGTSAVTPVVAPGASTARSISEVYIQNTDTVSATVTVSIDNGGTIRPQVVQTLTPGQTLQYGPQGWSVACQTGGGSSSTPSGAANLVYASPNGSSGNASLRGLVPGDLPVTGLIIDSHSGILQTDTDGATVTFDLSVSDWHLVTLGGNRTLALANLTLNARFAIALKQDGTGGRTVTWWSGIRWPGGIAPTLTAVAGQIDLFSFLYLGSGSYLGMVTQNF
jgi:hypothetical protein